MSAARASGLCVMGGGWVRRLRTAPSPWPPPAGGGGVAALAAVLADAADAFAAALADAPVYADYPPTAPRIAPVRAGGAASVPRLPGRRAPATARHSGADRRTFRSAR